MWGALIGSIVGGAAGALTAWQTNKALEKSKPNTVALPSLDSQYQQYNEIGAQLPGVASTMAQGADQDNARYLASLEQYYPGITGAIRQQGEEALKYQQGYIPQDVQDKIKRDQAQAAIQGGYQGSGFAGNQEQLATARMGLQNQAFGNQLATQVQQEAGALSPNNIDVYGSLLTPAQLGQRNEAGLYYNSDLANQGAAAAAAARMARLRQYGSGAGSLAGGASNMDYAAFGKMFSGNQSGGTGGDAGGMGGVSDAAALGGI